MTYYINGNKFPLKDNPQETYKEIVQYLNKISSIIVENGIPLDESEIIDRLEKQINLTFETKLILTHEKDVFNNVLVFARELLSNIENLNLKMKDNKSILESFFVLSNTLLELSNVDSYFGINKIVKYEIELSVKQAEQKIEENDFNSLTDIIELIYTEWLEGFIENLEKRKGSYQ